MSITNILTIIYYILAFIVAASSITVSIIKLHKAKKNADTAEKKVEIENQMELKAVELIGEAESFYKKLDGVLKSTTGESAGIYKKESVMNKLQSYATSLKSTFDYDYWSKKVDDLVSFTKEVNVKEDETKK